ncbi:MAG: carbohydrate ABC transporter permease [Propionibacteriaceae bacterium]|jgi:multiple sugar transport system permease protein|nr:carbohydrate ABC transporter permease [Propionibacteriaceae bacterium]
MTSPRSSTPASGPSQDLAPSTAPASATPTAARPAAGPPLRDVSQITPRRKTRKPSAIAARVALYAALIVAAAFLLVPFFWMVSSSLKNNLDVFSVPVRWIPEAFQWHNYADIWVQADMATWLKNTLILSVVVTCLQVLTGSFAAYGFSRIRFPGRDVLFLCYIATIAVPWQAYMIPQFLIMSRVGLVNTLWAMIVLQAFGAFGVFLMKQFFETVPEELSESARVDGLSEYGIYWRIMLPLSVPAIASLALLTFVNTWNDYLGPLIYLRPRNLFTIQLGLKTFQADPQGSSLDALVMTGSVLSVLPIAIIFLLGQRYFVEGIATTGLKG